MIACVFGLIACSEAMIASVFGRIDCSFALIACSPDAPNQAVRPRRLSDSAPAEAPAVA